MSPRHYIHSNEVSEGSEETCSQESLVNPRERLIVVNTDRKRSSK